MCVQKRLHRNAGPKDLVATDEMLARESQGLPEAYTACSTVKRCSKVSTAP